VVVSDDRFRYPANYCNDVESLVSGDESNVSLATEMTSGAILTRWAGLFNALFFGGMGRVSLKCHTPTQTAL
jgi:hypothetical protein